VKKDALGAHLTSWRARPGSPKAKKYLRQGGPKVGKSDLAYSPCAKYNPMGSFVKSFFWARVVAFRNGIKLSDAKALERDWRENYQIEPFGRDPPPYDRGSQWFKQEGLFGDLFRRRRIRGVRYGTERVINVNKVTKRSRLTHQIG
jgi:hypothetical protein